jgi:multiple sugar transport system substrate-binding protein
MFIKRFAVLSIVLAIMLAVLSACGGQPAAQPAQEQKKEEAAPAKEEKKEEAAAPAEEKKEEPAAAAAEGQTIRLWIWSQWNGLTGVEPNGQPLDWWKDRVAKWEAQHPGVKVELEDLNGQDVDINAKYDTAVAAGNIADIVWVDESYFTKYASQDVLEPIDAFMTDEDRKDFLPKDLELSRWDGKQFFWPYITQANHLAINVSLFKEKGVENLLPQAPDFAWTFEKFAEAAKAVTIDRDNDGKTDVYGVGFATDGAYTMAEAWGDHLYKQGDESKVTINTQNTLDAFKALKGLVEDGTAFPGSGTGAVDLQTNFLQQRIAMINTWGIVTDVETLPENEKFELMLVPFPHGPNGKPTVWGGVHGLGVTKQKDPERLKLVMDLGRYLTSTDALKDVRAWSKPARLSLLQAQLADQNFLYEKYIPQFEAYTGALIPLMGQGPNAVPVLIKYEPLVEAIFTGDLTAEDALKQFEQEANVILSE